MNNDKIVFAVKKITNGHKLTISSNDVYRYYEHVSGESSLIEKALKNCGYGEDWIKAINEAIEKGKDGRYVIGDFTIFILPSSMAQMHTCQNPLIVMKDDEVIDVDEFWYSSFKKMFQESFKCRTLSKFDDLNSIDPSTSWGYVEYDYVMKCTIDDSNSDAPLLAVRTQNITYGFD